MMKGMKGLLRLATNPESVHICIIRLICVLSVLFTGGCKKEKESSYTPTPYTIQIPKFFPSNLNIPADNPMTVEGITLGRYLFYDGRLSGRTSPDSLMSCCTCHIQEYSFTCGINNPSFPGGMPHGLTGIPTPHAMMPMINLAWNNNGYLWNGLIRTDNPDTHRRNIEDLVWMGITAPHEMHGDTSRTVALIQSIPGYPELFKKAFGSDKVTMKNIGKAIAQFIRTLISSNSRFDKYLRGETQLSEQELSGFEIFTTENGGDCFHCHGESGNPLFTTNLFYNNGKDTVFTDTRDRYHVTGRTPDIGAYKAPTLRNVEVRGPYMHDGRYKTLDEVIDFYSGKVVWSPYIDPLMHHVATGGVRLTSKQKSDLKAFIHTLRDDEFLTNPDFAKPATFPDGTK